MHHVFHKEPPVGEPKYDRDEQLRFEDRPADLEKSDLLSAADASFRSFLTEQLTRKHNTGLGRNVVISRREKNELFKPITNTLPDISRSDSNKRGQPLTVRKGTMDRESSLRRSQAGEESNMEEEKQKDDFPPQDNKDRRKVSQKNLPIEGKWAEVQKPEISHLNQRPRARLDGHLHTKTSTAIKPITKESPEKPLLTTSFDPKGKPQLLHGLHDKHATDEVKRRSALHSESKSNPTHTENVAEGKLTKDEWMNFRLRLGDSGGVKIELIPPVDSHANTDENSASSSKSSFFTSNKHGLHNQGRAPIHEQDVNAIVPHGDAIWDRSSIIPAVSQLRDSHFSELQDENAKDYRTSPASPKIARLLRRHASDRNEESLARSNSHEATKLLMHPINDEESVASTSNPSTRFVAATSGSSTLPRTAIIDSVAIPVSVDVEDEMYSGCPVQTCSTICPGNLRKLAPLNGCPMCECCPTLKCDLSCKLGYQADRFGCPMCRCVTW